MSPSTVVLIFRFINSEKKVENDDKWYKNYTEQQRVEMGGGVIFNHANINNNTNVLLKEIVFFSFILQNLLHVALMTIMM